MKRLARLEPPVRVAILCTALLAATQGCRSGPSSQRDATTERHTALVQRWFEEGFNQHHLNVVDELFAERVSINGQLIARNAVKQNMSRHLSGFPDLHVALDDVVAEGDKVDVWYTVAGTHRGPFEGVAPTGKPVTWTGADSFRIEGDRISEARFLSDLHGLLAQLDNP
jgi:predicted ester cyclase